MPVDQAFGYRGTLAAFSLREWRGKFDQWLRPSPDGEIPQPPLSTFRPDEIEKLRLLILKRRIW